MAIIRRDNRFGGHEVRVRHQDFHFRYIKPGPKDIKRKGKMLSMGYHIPTIGDIEIHLNGRKINTLKKVLKAAGEI